MESTPRPSTALRFLCLPYLSLSESSTSIPTLTTNPNRKEIQREPGRHGSMRLEFQHSGGLIMSSKPVWATWEDPVSYNKTTKGKVERCIQFLDFGILNHPTFSSQTQLHSSAHSYWPPSVSLHTFYTHRAPCLMLKTVVYRAL